MDKQRSKAWFNARKGRVTGSNAGAILGMNPFKGPDEVLREMVRSYHGAESEFLGNVATEYGTFHEDGAQAEYTMETGRTVTECGFYEFEDWLGASPDGLVGTEGLIEIKCPYGKRNGGDFKSIKEQPHYLAQMQIEMLCADALWVDFYQWSTHGTSLERVHLDEEWLHKNLPELKRFHYLFLSEIDNPEHLEPKRVEVNTLKAEKLVGEYEQLSEAIDRATERKKEVLSELVEIAGKRNAIIFGKKLTQVTKSGSVSYAKVVKDHLPDVDLEQYRGKASSFWRFS